MSTRSCTRSILGAAAVLSFAAIATADTVSAGDPPQRDRERPTAGAPYYLHFGPWGGLCTRSFDLSVDEGQAVLDEGAKVLYVRGRSDAETFVDFARDGMNTSSAWDDELVVTMTVYADGPDSIEMFTFPYFDTSGTGGTGGFTTTNEPTDTSVGFIFYRGSGSEKNALLNHTSMPMRADGWFSVLASGDDGFTGGNGPDCVKGSNNNDRVFTAAEPTTSAGCTATISSTSAMATTPSKADRITTRCEARVATTCCAETRAAIATTVAARATSWRTPSNSSPTRTSTPLMGRGTTTSRMSGRSW